jgi:adenylate kinase
VNVGDLIKQHKCFEGRDDELDTDVLDEDKLLDAMEVVLDKAAEDGEGIVVDYHINDIFPERWFDLVLVLRTKTDVLFDRLTTRGYNEKKRAENMEAEIMQVILDEAREAYAQEIVHEVASNTVEDMENNVVRVDQWCKQWLKDNGQDS